MEAIRSGEQKLYVELPRFTGRNVPIRELAAAMVLSGTLNDSTDVRLFATAESSKTEHQSDYLMPVLRNK